MARTRATKSTAKTTAESTPSHTKSTYELPSPTNVAQQVLILPSKATAQARIVTLPHPRHARPSRYLVCPQTGFYEFKKITPPQSEPRSWLLQPTSASCDAASSTKDQSYNAQLVSNAAMFLATAMDPLFLLIPAMLESGQTQKHADEKKRMFLSSDDHWDKLPTEHSHLNEIVRWPRIRQLLEDRMSAVCDTADVGDETMFRVNEEKLLAMLLNKSAKMAEGPLPKSMEEKFVLQALQAPILTRKREAAPAPTPITPDVEVLTPSTEKSESQSVATSQGPNSSADTPGILTPATSFSEDPPLSEVMTAALQADDNIIKLQRTRVAFDFICSAYVQADIATHFEAALADGKGATIDFAPLNDYMTKLAALKAEAHAARSLGDFSRKHGRDEEEDEARQEKKRKLEEEKKRKANESRGVKDLKKVNTSGMKKLSHFFQKK